MHEAVAGSAEVSNEKGQGFVQEGDCQALAVCTRTQVPNKTPRCVSQASELWRTGPFPVRGYRPQIRFERTGCLVHSEENPALRRPVESVPTGVHDIRVR